MDRDACFPVHGACSLRILTSSLQPSQTFAGQIYCQTLHMTIRQIHRIGSFRASTCDQTRPLQYISRCECLTIGPSQFFVARLQVVPSLIRIDLRQFEGWQGCKFDAEIYHFLKVDANAATKLRDDYSLQTPCTYTQAPHSSMRQPTVLKATLRLSSRMSFVVH
jgi:hypothetical protein